MRKWLKEEELKRIAEKISTEIVHRVYVNGTSYDERKASSPEEKEVLYNIAYGALLALNYGEEHRSSPIAERAIVNAAEFTVRLFLRDCNGYDSMYIPLHNALEEWEKEVRDRGQE